MDEFLEFDKKLVEGLRQPLEDKKRFQFQIKWQIYLPFGLYFSCCYESCLAETFESIKGIHCDNKIKTYLSRPSTPILDRMDIFVETSPISLWEVCEWKLMRTQLQFKRVEKQLKFKNRFKSLKIIYKQSDEF